MCNRVILLICFVVILSLGGDVLAKDLNPPDFAGGNQTGVIIWGFDEDSDQPTGFRYLPRSRDEKEGNRFGFRYYDDSWEWQEGGYLAMVGVEESLVMPLPAGDGANSNCHIGSFNGKVYQPETPKKLRFNHGGRYYAAQTFRDTSGRAPRRIQMALHISQPSLYSLCIHGRRIGLHQPG